MGQLSYQDYESQKQQANNQGPRIGYFALKNDKDEAVVRFMHQSPADFDINLVHGMSIDGKFKKVNCIRELNQPTDACPLCAAGVQLQKRIYIHLVEYVKQEDGTFKGIPKFWERSSAYITTMANLCTEYGDLSECLFKVKRNGESGSVDTTYDIMFASPAIYRNDIYTKDPEAFKDVKALGKAIINKSYDQLKTMISGEVNQSASVSANTTPVEPAHTPTYVQPEQPQPMRTYTPNIDPVQAPRTYTPTEVFGGDDEPFGKPRRIYEDQ